MSVMAPFFVISLKLGTLQICCSVRINFDDLLYVSLSNILIEISQNVLKINEKF